MAVPRLLALLALLLPVTAAAQLAGDRWEARRGDLTPNLQYNAVARTPSGRLIAVGDSGQLMVSDDGGASWRFRQMETATGGVLRAGLTDIVAFTTGGTTRVVAIASTLEGGGVGQPNFVGRTYTYQSLDDGQTWTEHPFPFTSAVKGGQTYHGVTLHGLHVTSTNLLLAFGTTSRSDNGLFVWSTGGLIYRSGNGADWELANFSHGPVYQVAKAGARLVAAGVSSVFDSADGAGWNGYLLRAADLEFPDGTPLDAAERDRVDLEDIAVEDDGTYVIRAAVYTTAGGTRQFVMRAPAPFGPGREWTMEEHSTFFGTLLPSSNGLLGFASTLFRTLDHGAGWSILNADVAVPTGSVVRTSAAEIVGVSNANTVWKSASDGATWSKVWDKTVGPNLRPVATVDGTVYAFGGDDNLWASDSNGDTWQLRATNVNGNSIVGRNGRLIRPSGAHRVFTSDDRGFTWDERPTGGPSNTPAYGIIEANAGRLLVIAEGKDALGRGKFFISDDDGTTWEPRSVDGLRFNDDALSAARLASGRLVAGTNEFAGFRPFTFISDDNGDTWTGLDNVRFIPGLDPITNVPGEHVLEMVQLAASPTGRVLLRGRDEMLTSDDGGETWTLRFNGNPSNAPGSPLIGEIFDLERLGGRWIAIGYRRDPQNRPVHFALISDDDGSTWREVSFRLNQTNTFLQSLTVGRGGRLIAGGSNAAIYVSDGTPPPPEPTSATQQVREANGIEVVVPRPPIPGNVEALYSAVSDTAIIDDDYVPASGVLTWTEDETEPKSFPLATVDDAAKEPDEQIRVRLSFRNEDVGGTSEIVVIVRDDDGGTDAAIQLDGAAFLYTSEMGDSATVRVALNRLPTANVTLTIDNVDATEGTVMPGALTFTPQNWNVQQELVVTGLDDVEADGHVSYTFRLTPTSADTAYNALPKSLVSVVNVDDEPPTASTSTTTLPPSTVTSTTVTATTTSVPATSTTTLPAVTSTTVPAATTTTTTLPPCTTARCIIDDTLRTGACADEQPPAAIAKKLDQSAAAISALPQQSAKKAKATRKKAKRLLKAAGKAAVKASKGKRPKLTADCARAIDAAAKQVAGGL